jgi:subtilase family serine protease
MNATRNLKSGFAALVTAGLLCACGGGSSTPLSPVPSGTAQPAGSSSGASSPAAAVAYGAGLLTGATYVKRATLGTVGADVSIAMRDPAGLEAYAKESNDPSNALYRHWLTPQELGDRFGASVSDYTAAQKYFVGNGIGVQSYPQRQILRIHGPQANVERALGLQFGTYRKNGQTFVAPVGAPRPAISLHVAAVGNVVRYQTRSRRLMQLRAASAFVEGYAPEQIAGGFDFTGAYNAGYKGAGITIGIIGTGPITDGDPRIGLGDAADFRAVFKISGSGKVVQDVDLSNYSPGDGAGGPTQYSQSGLATPPPVTSPFVSACTNLPGFEPGQPSTYGAITDYTTCNPEDFEAQLDTEQASALAPDANVNFYIAFNPSECFGSCTGVQPAQELGIAEADDEIQQAIADDKSDIVSMSFGEDEISSEEAGYFGATASDPSFEPVEFASLVSEGIAVFASSGDQGAEECQLDQTFTGQPQADEPCVSYPATDPSVISVGGVNSPLDDSGRLTGPLTGWGLATQLASIDAGEGAGGSGGGCSAYFAIPAYESGVTLPCSGKRPQPDVALDADTNTGVAVDIDADSTLGGRLIVPIGGTSVSSPEMAAMWALVLDGCKSTAACVSHGTGATAYRLGNPGTYLYKIYRNQTEYPEAFYDVLFGNNSLPSTTGNGQDPGFNAGKGFDEVTGVGAPYARNLISAVLANVP